MMPLDLDIPVPDRLFDQLLLGQGFFDPAHIQASSVASLETVEHFARFLNLSRLVIKDAERGITAGPLRQ